MDQVLTIRRASSFVTRTFGWCALAIGVTFGSAGTGTAQTGSFSGTVLADSSEKPLTDVEITFTDLKRSVRSDKAGNFLFGGLPLGKHSVVVRLVGYESVTTHITLVDVKPLEVDLFLKQTTTVLKNIEVKASARYATKLAEFEDRRATAAGRFLTADFFEQQRGRPLSSFLMQKIPGISFVNSSSGRRWLATTSRGNSQSPPRGAGGLETPPPACYAMVIINGLIRYDGSPNQPLVDIDEINSLDVIGLEFYTTATTPLQYNKTRGTSGCGTVIIWTK